MKFNPKVEVDFLKHEYFVRGVLSPTRDSTEYWKRWLDQNPEKVELYRSACAILLSFELKQKYAMEDSSYYRVLDCLLEENNKPNNATRIGILNSDSRLMAAASIVLFVSLSFISYFIYKSGSKQIPKIVEYHVESVPRGFKKTIILPDGSAVKLNSMSEIKYVTQFSDTIREVYLTGQGFFEVKKNPNAPFIVHTKYFSTRVLGTSFDIRSYENEMNKHVAVLTGNVQVTTTAGLAEMLAPLDITTYNQERKSFKKSLFNPNDVLSWQNDVIVFHHADFKSVTEYLSRWYGVDFVVEKGFEVKGYYNGRFKHEALTTVLQGISYSSHFKFRVENKKVIISKPNPIL